MFEKFPKKRVVLPEAYQKIYAEHYVKNREGQTTATGIAQKMERWMHKKVVQDVLSDSAKTTLEIGAGALNHLAYESTKVYDIVEPFTSLWENSGSLQRIRSVYHDITEVPAENSYDRIISIATFEHIENLPEVVAKACLMLNDSGTLRTAIPNEGTILWKLGYTLTTGIEYRLKYGLDYRILMNYEHINTAQEIEEILHYFLNTNQRSCFGLNKSFAFYRFYESCNPNRQRAEEYLKSIEKIGD